MSNELYAGFSGVVTTKHEPHRDGEHFGGYWELNKGGVRFLHEKRWEVAPFYGSDGGNLNVSVPPCVPVGLYTIYYWDKNQTCWRGDVVVYAGSKRPAPQPVTADIPIHPGQGVREYDDDHFQDPWVPK